MWSSAQWVNVCVLFCSVDLQPGEVDAARPCCHHLPEGQTQADAAAPCQTLPDPRGPLEEPRDHHQARMEDLQSGCWAHGVKNSRKLQPLK